MKFRTAVSALRPDLTGLRLAFGVALGLMVHSANAITIPEAVDTPTWVWNTGGPVLWVGESTVTHDGVDAAQSGAIGNSQTNYVETTIVGPGKLFFWWKVSSENNPITGTLYDFLSFTVNGVLPSSGWMIGGEVNWQRRTYSLLAGTNTVRWSYSKDGSDSDPFHLIWDDRAWLDEVVFIPTVTTTNDGGPFSLRQVIADAPTGSTIIFDPSLSAQTIVLTNGQLLLDKNLTIDASALPAGIKIDGNHASRIFQVASGTTNVLTSLTLTNGYIAGGAGGAVESLGHLTLNDCQLLGNQSGGTAGALAAGNGVLTMNQTTVSGNSCDNVSGIYLQDLSATLTGCTFSDNTGAQGDALLLLGYYASASLTMANSTFSGNVATNSVGSAIRIEGSGATASAILNHCTISSNNVVQPGQPGAIQLGGTVSLTLSNSIVSGNSSGGVPSDITGGNATGSSFNNLIGTGGGLVNGINGNQVGINDPQLAPLGDYGGPTPTMLPLPGSPAIDAGVATSLATDQRGYPRIIGPAPDIGAVETTPSPIITTLSDSGPGSMRYAVTHNGGGSILTFDAALSGQTIVLTNGQLLLDKNLTIDASALPGGLAIDGNGSNRVFEVASGTTNVLTALTITNGYALGSTPNEPDSWGGGIYNQGNLTVNECTLAGNSAAFGGGILNDYNGGTLTVNQSTLSGNSALYSAGGLYNGDNLTVNQSTLADNSGYYAGGIYNDGLSAVNQSTLTGNAATNTAAFSSAGGIYNNSGTSTLSNTIVAGNSSPANPELFVYAGAITTLGNNLTNGVPQLAPLGNYGGPTPTMPPLPGSPAIDGCTNDTSFTTDQRGFPRIVGPFADIGAVEYETSLVVTTNADAGPGSLRYAITYSTNGSTLAFDASLSAATIMLTNGQLLLDKNLTIDASPLPAGITISGNHASRIFEVAVGANVVLDSLTITNGKTANGTVGTNGVQQVGSPGGAGSPGESGGGILNQGTLTLNRVTLSGNTAGNGGQGGDAPQGPAGTGGSGGVGGAIYNASTGTLNILNSTIANNASGSGANGGSGGVEQGNGGNGGSGGGIANAGILRLTHTTVTANAAGTRGNTGSVTPSHGIGGGVRTTGTLHLTNTIVALNTAPGVGPDLSSSANSIGGVNFIGNTNGATGLGAEGVDYLTGDPQLHPLGNYGGPTWTRSPMPGSPVVDATSSGLATDQRGGSRPQGAQFDIGSVEGAFNPEFTLVSTALGGGGNFQFAFNNLSAMPFTVLTSTNMALPLNQWTVHAAPVEFPPGSGQYEFTDSLPANDPQRFYCVAPGHLPRLRWASSVIGFSSQFSADGWSAAQALGQPDTYPTYGDISTAWATLDLVNPDEFIELGFDDPAPADSVSIYETFNPGAVSKVSVRNADTSLWVEVWSGTAAPAPAEARIFTVTFPETNFPVDAVRIDLDSPAVPGWNEIDAVSIGGDW